MSEKSAPKIQERARARERALGREGGREGGRESARASAEGGSEKKRVEGVRGEGGRGRVRERPQNRINCLSTSHSEATTDANDSVELLVGLGKRAVERRDKLGSLPVGKHCIAWADLDGMMHRRAVRDVNAYDAPRGLAAS